MKSRLLFVLIFLGLAASARAQQAGAPLIPTAPSVPLGAGVSSALANPANSNGGVPLLNGSASPGNCLTWGAAGIQDAGSPCLVSPLGSVKLVGSGAANAASLADRATDVGVTFNLKTDFGAKCDGASDDTAAIQGWLNKAAAGVTLVAPAGTCLFSSPVAAPTANGYAVVGAGVSATILKYTGAATASNLIALGAATQTGVLVRDFSVTSNNAVSGALVELNGAAFTPNGSGGRFIVNVVDFGADPSGAKDSTAAFNAAVSAGTNFNTSGDGYHPRPCLYAPAGLYRITDAITLPAFNGCLFGDGRQLSVLSVSSASFNLSAKGVIVLPPNGGATTSEIHDIGISFSQPDTGARANIVAFPPGVYAQDAGRPLIRNVRIGGGAYCIDARGNVAGFFQTIECGSLIKGLQVGSNSGSPGSMDGMHIEDWHFWDFGFSGSGLQSVFCDGTNVSMQVGRVDWLSLSNAQHFCGNIVYLSEAAGIGIAHQWSNVTFDTSRLIMDGGIVQASNVFGASPPAITLEGAGNPQLFIRNAYLSTAQGAGGLVNISAGALQIEGGQLGCGSIAYSCVIVTGGSVELDNMQFSGAYAAWRAPYISQSSSGFVRLKGDIFTTPGYAGNVGVQFATDAGWNYFSPVENVLNGWSWTPPTSGSSSNSFYGAGIVAMPKGNAFMTLTAQDGTSAAGLTMIAGSTPYNWFFGLGAAGAVTLNTSSHTSLAAWPDGHVAFGAAATTNESVGALQVDQGLTVLNQATYLAAKTVAQVAALGCNGGDRGAVFTVTDLAATPTYFGVMGAGGGSITSLVQCDGTNWRNH